MENVNVTTNGTELISDHNEFYSILKDLTENSDRMWLVLIILISLSVLIICLIFMLVRKHYLGYCWTAHKKEYEPNNKNAPKNGYFDKNSINNKSFRQKNGELIDEHNNRSNLIASDQLLAANEDHVKLNMDQDTGDPYADPRIHHQPIKPLKSSTSTPV